ncbi:MAG: hypothetical protein KatS3mg129_1286 [Leptospiraceae bacterium]|nr:MAG: hypothetical protein KatS3mg129_1286 [Leptospiraceae bacterium]
MEIIKKVLLIFIILLYLNPIFSLEKSAAFDLYEPGIFNPLGPTLIYGDPDIRKRPYMLIALNGNDQIVEKSLLQYNKEGRLIGEKIFDAKNHYKGEITYIYDEKGNIIEERYLDEKGNLIAKKIRYYKKNILVQIDIFNKEEYVFSRKYKYDKNQIIGREFQKGASDPFIIKLNHGYIESVVFKDKNTILMEIKYKYNKGKLIERIKHTGEAKSKCEYFYDNENRLKEYIYYDFIRNQWKKYKTIQFVYADQV